MECIEGKFIMSGCAMDAPDRLHNPDDLMNLLHRVGFIPLFSGPIPGFSVEEHTAANDWWTGNGNSDPWEWRHILTHDDEIAYGKFFGEKAGFIAKEWFPVFANYRRNGYDFDALYNDGFAPIRQKRVMDCFDLTERMEGKSLTAAQIADISGERDYTLVPLQMQTYLIISDFRQRRNKAGKPYGLFFGVYETPETKWGYDFVTEDYSVEPQESWQKICNQIKKEFPDAIEDSIHKVLGIRYKYQSQDDNAPKKKESKHPSSNHSIHPSYPENIITAIGLERVFGVDAYTPLTVDQAEGLEYAIRTLSATQQELLKLRFKEYKTLANIGIKYDRSKERIRQQIALALRLLRTPSRIEYYKKGYKSAVAYFEEQHERVKRIQEEEELAKSDIDKIREMPIAKLDLSVRGFNALTRTGIINVGNAVDLISTNPSELSEISNFGLHSQLELLRKLKELGFDFTNDIDHITTSKIYYKSTVEPEPIPENVPLQEKSISELNFTVRGFNALTSHGVETVGDILRMTKEELMKIKEIGKGTYRDIISKLKDAGADVSAYDDWQA